MPTDPRGLRSDAPLLDAWLRFHEKAPTPFTIPGHKHRHDLVGDVIAGDVPYYAGLDTMKVTRGVLAQAQDRAARAWGADAAFLLVGGSTQANQAAVLAVGRPGDRVLVGRALHRSVLLGLVLAGLEPVWLDTGVDSSTGLPQGISREAIEDGLRRAPDAVAAFVTDPTYVGTLGDVGGAAQAGHTHGIPLIVDAAWAAHFGFHPDLPAHALTQGADALVTSAHKTLPAWSQGALLLARTERIDPARLEAAVEASATTSPSGAILASVDAARALLETAGEELLGALISVVAQARSRLAEVPGLVVPNGPDVDPAKLIVLLSGTGADGVAVEQDLLAAGMPVEMADRDTIVALVTLADRRADVARFVDVLIGAVERHRGMPRALTPSVVWSVRPEAVLSPREAFFAPTRTVPADEAVGQVSAELIAPYPPGIPALAPGERITAELLDALRAARTEGTRIAYAADPSLETLRVVR